MRRQRLSKFKLQHPEKYDGDVADVVPTSQSELELCQFLDNNVNILTWRKSGNFNGEPQYWTRYKTKDGDIAERVVNVANVKPAGGAEPTSGKSYKQGIFKPKHPEKYKGDLNKIVYRSSWELNFNQFLDNNHKVIEWASEEIAIPYLKPTDNRIHRYFPDYWVKYIDEEGNERVVIIEVKPHAQTKAPRKSRNPNSQLYAELQYAVNLSKWQAAREFCMEHNMEFRLITEKELFL